MTHPTKDLIEYCYSTDEEYFNMESMGEAVDYITDQTDEPIGATYWRGEKVELTYKECIDVSNFLERCDELAYEEIGEMYDSCFADVSDDAKEELEGLLLAWAKKHVHIRYWKVSNVQEMKITKEDLE